MKSSTLLFRNATRTALLTSSVTMPIKQTTNYLSCHRRLSTRLADERDRTSTTITMGEEKAAKDLSGPNEFLPSNTFCHAQSQLL